MTDKENDSEQNPDKKLSKEELDAPHDIENAGGEIPVQASESAPDSSGAIDVSMDDYDEDLFSVEDDQDLLSQISGVYKIWGNWAYFEISIITPNIAAKDVVEIIQPEVIGSNGELEFVYPIFDYGDRLSTSKASEMYSVGTSMCKLFYTIEKIIAILVDRVKGGGAEGVESQVNFEGHQTAQRKAFESIINLDLNMVVTNFDPGEWGERYLQVIKKMADLGYGYPPEAPRYNYKSVGGRAPEVARATK